MALLIFHNQSYQAADEESILNCLLRNGVDYPNACQSGICQTCLIKATDGIIEPSWQEGLPETLKAQGYFLSCLAKPSSQMRLKSPDTAECDLAATIIASEPLTYNVVKLKLAVDNPDAWIPGQYLNLINSDNIARSYSIANIPWLDGYLELHIKLYPNGAMSQWLRDNMEVNRQVRLRGPFGKCYYYNPNGLTYDILLTGTGTGLAPLIAIARNAISQGHNGNITLVHGGCVDEDIYYAEELQLLSERISKFHYNPCVLKSQGRYQEAAIEQQLLKHLADPNNTQVYVCGPKETTNKLKMKAFLAGVPSKNIFSDAFI